MATAYESTGRVRQKQRTRAALVVAAQDLLARGETPTVDAAAAQAAVSRTTAYRYFPSQTALLAAAHPETSARSLLPPDPPGEPAARLDAVVDAFTRLIADTQPQQRAMLRLSLDPVPHPPADLPLRQGRAIGWFLEALEPLGDRLSPAELTRLAVAVRSAVGIEALVWLTDVAGLSTEEAGALMRWSATSMLHAALTRAAPPTGAEPDCSTT